MKGMRNEAEAAGQCFQRRATREGRDGAKKLLEDVGFYPQVSAVFAIIENHVSLMTFWEAESMAGNEKIYRPAWKSFYRSISLIVLGAAVVIALTILTSFQAKVKGVLWAAWVVVAIAIFLYMVVRRASISLTVRPDEVALDQGILNRKSIEISYSSIRTVEVTQTLTQRVLNLGDLFIASSGTGEYEMQIRDMPDPHAIRDEIQANERSVKGANAKAGAAQQEDAEDA